MYDSFNISKIEFYKSLRTDPLVQELGTEEFIRDYTEKLIAYNKQANIANKIFGKTPDYPELFMDFKDVKSISYTLGTRKKEKNLIKRILKSIFMPTPPLTEKLYEHMRNFYMFKKTGEIDENCIEDDILPHLHTILDKSINKKFKKESIKKVYRKAAEHIERMRILYNLSKSSHNIGKFYGFPFEYILNDPAFSEILTFSDIIYITFNLKRQSEINRYGFKTTYLAALRADNIDDAELRVETSEKEICEHLEDSFFSPFMMDTDNMKLTEKIKKKM